jgi:peptidoglycan-associated lipoprotein
MKLLKSIALIAFTISTTQWTNAQCDNKYTEVADKNFRSGFYFLALGQYQKALGKAKKDKEAKDCITYQIAECYRITKDYKKAEAQYKRYLKSKTAEPKGYLMLAMVMKLQGNYEGAKVEFDNFKEKMPSDPRGEIGSKSAEMAASWRNNPTCYVVENIKTLNTKFDDYSPTYSGKKYDQIIFASSREDAKGRPDVIMGQTPEDLFEAKIAKNGKWSTPTPLFETINTKFSEGAPTMNKRFNTVYFTRCGSDKKAAMGCQIYTAKRQGPTRWSEATMLEIAADTLVVGHPTLSGDAKMIIFASNMPGGYGGMDLWIAEYDRRKKTYINPKNLGPNINSASNEMYPHWRADGTLFFSSDRLEGMGGLDIYRAFSDPEKANSWLKPENMKYPINSEADDFGITFKGSEEAGMLTSNRKGGRGGDDIYEFSIPNSSVADSGLVVDVDTKKPIASAKLVFTNSSDEKFEVTTDKDGKYKLPVSFNETYAVVVSKDKYFNVDGQISTMGIDPLYTCKDSVMFHKWELKTSEVTLNYEVLFYFDSEKFYPEYADTLMQIVDIMVKNPTLRVEIGAHTDSRGSADYNQKLSDRRAKEVVAFLVSKGVAAERLQPKGYGKSEPRKMEKNYRGVKVGTVITDDFIKSLATEEERENAHTLNRRVTLKRLDNKYKPKELKKKDEEDDDVVFD